MTIRLENLSEDQILAAIHNHFERDAMVGINMQPFIQASTTLDELMIEIATAIELRECA